MKRKKSGSATTDLRSFLKRAAAKKKQPDPENVNLSTMPTNESQMQFVVFQGHSSSGTGTEAPEGPEPMSTEAEGPEPVNTEAPEGSEPMSTEAPGGPEPVRTEPPEPAREDDEIVSSDEDSDYGIEHDPGLRAPISSYAVNDQDSVRRAYIALGPCRPNMKNEDFPQHKCGGMRRFQPEWFDEFKWLEYSMDKDAAFCFVCFLFKDSCRFRGGDAFVDGGFRNWNMKVRFRRHAGAIDSANSKAEEKYNMFTRPKVSIREFVASNTTLQG